MKTILVGFSKPIVPTLFSRLIMWSEKTPYDHVYIAWYSNSIDREIIYQASKLAVNFETGNTFYGHAITVEEYTADINDECYKRVLQFCMDNSNKPYGIKEIFGYAWVKICAWFGKTVHNPFPANGSEFVCSQLGSEILNLAKITNTSGSSSDVTPLSLNMVVRSAGLKRTV